MLRIMYDDSFCTPIHKSIIQYTFTVIQLIKPYKQMRTEQPS